MTPTLRIRGFEVYKGLMSDEGQKEVVNDLREIIRVAPLFSPQTPFGKPMTVRMTSAGTYGWVSDQRGYRYEKNHPNGMGWPEIPASVLAIWDKVTGLTRRPECCLINFYTAEASMGMHQDNDEASFDWPVVSVSLGDDGLFRIGNPTRGGKTESIWLSSGDVVVMAGAARLTYHGLDRIRPGTSTLLKDTGRLNLTLRVVE